MTTTALELAADLSPELAAQLASLVEDVEGYAERALAASTRRTYAVAWTDWTDWTEEHGFDPLPAPAPTVAIYLAHLAREGYAASTIRKRLAVIRRAHRLAGEDDPYSDAVAKIWQGIRRSPDVAPAPRGKAPLLADDIRAMLDALDTDRVRDIRDRALIALGYAGGFRRSELVGLDVDDIREEKRGLLVTLRRSKTNQEGELEQKALTYGRTRHCPANLLARWRDVADIECGALFRRVDRWGNVYADRYSAQGVWRSVRRAAKLAGLDVENIGAHSLRAGFVSAAKAAGLEDVAVMDITGHASAQTLRIYDRASRHFRCDTTAAVGL